MTYKITPPRRAYHRLSRFTRMYWNRPIDDLLPHPQRKVVVYLFNQWSIPIKQQVCILGVSRFTIYNDLRDAHFLYDHNHAFRQLLEKIKQFTSVEK